MIQSFRHKGLRALFETGRSGAVDPRLRAKIRVALTTLDRAIEVGGLPGPGLHKLIGDRAGTWSMWVSASWRITFRFEDGDVFDVDLVDYH